MVMVVRIFLFRVSFIGAEVALFARDYLPRILVSLPSFKAKDYETALAKALLEVERILRSEAGKKTLAKIHSELTDKLTSLVDDESEELADAIGCTACVTIITESKIYVANIGDSRCVLCKGGIAINLSKDHKPELEEEKQRIEKAGGYVEENRVNGSIALSRTLGDFRYKKNTRLSLGEQLITPFPDIKVEPIEKDTQFLLIASDGIWDFMSSQNAVEYIREQMAKCEFTGTKDLKMSTIIEKLFDKVMTKNIKLNTIGSDNMSCILIKFKHL